jgi:hypothetical protein
VADRPIPSRETTLPSRGECVIYPKVGGGVEVLFSSGHVEKIALGQTLRLGINATLSIKGRDDG